MVNRTAIRRVWGIVVVALLLVAGCGGDDDTDSSSDTDSGGSSAATDEGQADDTRTDDIEGSAEDLAEDLVDDLEETQAAQGGGGATITVGDTTWEFSKVLCAFGEDEIGQEGAEFVLSSIENGLQLYVSVDSFGHSVSIDDIEDFQNPTVSLSAASFDAAMTGGPEEFVELDGKDVAATALFLDGTSDSFEGIEGTLAATCP